MLEIESAVLASVRVHDIKQCLDDFFSIHPNHCLFDCFIGQDRMMGNPIVVRSCRDEVKTGDTMELSMSDGTAQANGKTYSCTKLPEYMQNILNQGGLIASLNREEE